jgi:hypothetical protein
LSVDVLAVALILASRVLPLIEPYRLKVLPLLDVCEILHSKVISALQDGQFLQHSHNSLSPSNSSSVVSRDKVAIPVCISS